MRRAFAALGIHVIDMLVEGQLVPLLAHLGQVVAAQKTPDDAGRTLGCRPEIVGKLELPLLVAVGTHDVLHDLHEDARSVAAQARAGGVDDLVIEDAEPQQAVPGLGAAGVQIAQEVDHGIGHPGNGGIDKFLDAMRMQMRISSNAYGFYPPFQHPVDQTKYVHILAVKKKPSSQQCAVPPTKQKICHTTVTIKRYTFKRVYGAIMLQAV